MLPLPFKLNQAGRHHIPRQQHKVTNWPAYDASLRQRGSLTVWFSDEAIAAWTAEPRTTRGGQPWYSELAILTALTLRAAYRLALRQTEGLIGSLMRLLGLDLPVPDHTTLSRRAATLEVLTLATVPSPCTSWWTAWASSSESYPHFTWLKRWSGRVRSPRRGSSERTSLSIGSASRGRHRTCGRGNHPAGQPHAERLGWSQSIRPACEAWPRGP